MLDTLGPNYQQRVGDCLSDYYSVLNQWVIYTSAPQRLEPTNIVHTVSAQLEIWKKCTSHRL